MNRGHVEPGDDVMVKEEGGSYHSSLGCIVSGCGDIGMGDMMEMEVTDAEDEGFEPCKACVIGPWNGDTDRRWEI